ncbi:MAG: GxxExxY protein [Bacteroidota bacterium]
MEPQLLHYQITDKIIKAFYTIYNTLGYGFLEKVYENALSLELRKLGLVVEGQAPIKAHYQGILVGEYFANLLVEGLVIIELKAAEGIAEEHEAQLLNYLKATEIEVGFLLNFGPKPQFQRKIFTNDQKTRRIG